MTLPKLRWGILGVAGINKRLIPAFKASTTGRKLLAHLPGGDLELEWAGDDQTVFMTGPATEVFSGEWLDN